MASIMKQWLPPPSWRRSVIISLGIIAGFTAYIFYLSQAWSYLSDDPQACVNCHIMNPEYSTWSHSAHREYAHCNDCHVPHNNIFRKYYFKAADGMRHATIFTLRAEPQVIMIREAGINVVQENCIRCHSHTLYNEIVPRAIGQSCCFDDERLCWDCHKEVPHGSVKSLSSAPFARIPIKQSPVPRWLQKIVKK